ncbi:MAG TPA: ABC-type transport auxiliary lipoprotein family protein [Labilithrix sp.]|nr:ABC-type transport auxiliary lipoprotein family protein [Labilithrix sp.]
MKKHDSMIAVALLAAAALAGTAGCALTSKADVVNIRYFSPEVVKPRLTGADASTAPAAPAPHDALEVRLGRVSSGSNLRERIAYRDAAYELGYYDDLRWTERPETFVRRELGRTLFEEHGFRRVLGGSAPSLEVEVIAFDDLRLPSGRAARVQLKVILFEDSGVVYEDTFTVDRAVAGDKPKIEDVVAAMSSALDLACEQVATRTSAELAKRRRP